MTILLSLGLGVMNAASNESRSSTPQEVFDGMRQSFRADKAKGLNVRYQFNLSGPNGGDWFIDVNDGKFKMARGKTEKPTVLARAPNTLTSKRRAGATRSPSSASAMRPAARADQYRKTARPASPSLSEPSDVKRLYVHCPAPNSMPT